MKVNNRKTNGSYRIETVGGWELREVYYQGGGSEYIAKRFSISAWLGRRGKIEIIDGVATPALYEWEQEALSAGEEIAPEIERDLEELKETAGVMNRIIKEREEVFKERGEGNWVDGVLSVEEAAGHAGVGQETIRRWCRAGELGHYKIGNTIRIKRSDLRDYVENQYRRPRRLRDRK